MIVLIAMILVAGVAASVLVTTSNTLQSQAMKTGSQTTREVSSGLSVTSVIGQVQSSGSAGGDIERLAITVSAKPGSDKIDLSNTYILLSDGSQKSLITYAGSSNGSYWNGSVTGDIFEAMTWSGTNDTVSGEMNASSSSNWTWTSEQFGIGVLQDYDGSMTQTNPVLTRGDKAILYFRCDGTDSNPIYYNGSWSGNGWYNCTGVFGSQIGERVEIFGRIIPEIGAPGVISFTSPKAYVDRIYTLQ
jgi:flagellin FlaB